MLLHHEYLLRQELVQLCVQDHLCLFRSRVSQTMRLLLYDLLQHLAAERFKCEVGIVAEF